MTEHKMVIAKRITGVLIMIVGILILLQSYLGFVRDQVMAMLQAEAGSPAAQIDFMSAFLHSFEYVQGIATFVVSVMLITAGLIVIISKTKTSCCFHAAAITAIASVIGIVLFVPVHYSMAWCVIALVLAVLLVLYALIGDAHLRHEIRSTLAPRRVMTYLSKPQNTILLVLGIILTVTTIFPMVTILQDTFRMHPGSIDTRPEAAAYTFEAIDGTHTTYNWTNLLGDSITTRVGRQRVTISVASTSLLTPLFNSVLIRIFACFGAILYGGIFAYLVTRTNLKFKKYLSSIFIFPYIMPQWTLAVMWQNLFNSNAVTGGNDGLFVALFNTYMPKWWCEGLFPVSVVLAIHYAPFAYILIGGIFRNMDANLEEAATILNTPRYKTFFRVTLPLVKPAILSTVLLVFSSAMGSYPIPHYLGLTTLSTQYVGMSSNRAGQASILAVIMMLFGFLILIVNQRTTSGRKNFTTVTGKSGQSSVVNLGSVGKYVCSILFVLLTLFTGILPIILFAVETFLPNPGDYSFLTHGIVGHTTTKWWVTSENVTENGMYGQKGILYNADIWNAFGGTFLVAICCALVAGTIGTLIGYCVSKNRRSKWASYVNNMAFLPYLMPSLAVGVAFFIFGSGVGIYNTFLLLILAGTVKYIPFASRSALNSMMQLSGEIEEAAIIQDIPWWKRMTRIIIPIQKTSIISGFLLPFMTCLRELTLFMLLCGQGKIITTMLGYFDEMGLYAFSSGINLILIVLILLFNTLVNKLTGASIDSGIGGGD